METKALAIERDIVEKEFITDLLSKAERATKALESKVQ